MTFLETRLTQAAFRDKTYTMFDSGVRGAADVFKALAQGAKFVFVGRLWVWGLSIKSELGVRHVMKSLLADFECCWVLERRPDYSG
jgi:isopentenyl diphosphate isomerase/L-lactate dehydrogenase-like FMN-dependent dehydrogenase